MSDTINGYQTLAWIAWRVEVATDVFGGADGKELWESAKQGIYPAVLGAPVTKPAIAEMQLQAAYLVGRINPIRMRS